MGHGGIGQVAKVKGLKIFEGGYFYIYSEYIFSVVFPLKMSFYRISYLFRKSKLTLIYFFEE